MPAKGMKPETQHSQSGLCTFFSTFKLNSARLTIMLTFFISKQSKCGRISFLIRQELLDGTETLVLSFDSCAPQGHQANAICQRAKARSIDTTYKDWAFGRSGSSANCCVNISGVLSVDHILVDQLPSGSLIYNTMMKSLEVCLA